MKRRREKKRRARIQQWFRSCDARARDDHRRTYGYAMAVADGLVPQEAARRELGRQPPRAVRGFRFSVVATVVR